MKPSIGNIDEYGKKNKKLVAGVLAIIDKYLEEILAICFEAIDNFPLTEEEWDEIEQQIEDLFFKCLIEIYKFVLQQLEEIYGPLNGWSLEDLLELYQLTYEGQDTDWSLNCAIAKWWKEAYNTLATREKRQTTNAQLKKLLTYEYDRLLRTEGRRLAVNIKREKFLHITGYVWVVDADGCTCEHCAAVGGYKEYDDENEIPEWPPYHPQCSAPDPYPVPTDDEDDIHDGDLEIEEIEKK